MKFYVPVLKGDDIHRIPEAGEDFIPLAFMLRKAYRIDDDIPVLLTDAAVDVEPEEHDRLMALSGTE